MYINTNISALQSVYDLQNTENSLSNVLLQLSSGYQINSAADNPAGLAISQQMQSQINGLNQAAQNAQAGISLLQTADGALANIDSILQSMRSLASQAATGTNNPQDLQALQQEMNQYAQEITTITNTTQFNTLSLLSGAFGGDGTPTQFVQIGANQGQVLGINIGPMDAVSLGVAGFTATVSTSATGITATLVELGSGLQAGNSYSVVYGITTSTSGTSIAYLALDVGTSMTPVGTYYFSSTTISAGTYLVGVTDASQPSAGELVGINITGSTTISGAQGTLIAFTVNYDGSAATVIGNGQVASYAVAGSGLDISSQASAEAALTRIDNAIQQVNNQRAAIGAYQNRLQFAVSDAQTGSNNLSAAQAGILDTNVALAMANLSRYQILQQSGVAMLAQANAIPQALLKLFP